MKRNYSIWLWTLALRCFFASCKKEKEDTLPPATQIGAGTFGCKINGKVYIPKGSSGTGAPNPKVQYDVDLNGQPYLSIKTFQFPTTISSGIFVGFQFLQNTGMYSLKNSFSFLLGTPSTYDNCGSISNDPNTFSDGGGMVTRLDIPSRIISGTFDFKYKTLQCDTVFVTEGRFDIKF